jgi:hypothetical protein
MVLLQQYYPSVSLHCGYGGVSNSPREYNDNWFQLIFAHVAIRAINPPKDAYDIFRGAAKAVTNQPVRHNWFMSIALYY